MKLLRKKENKLCCLLGEQPAGLLAPGLLRPSAVLTGEHPSHVTKPYPLLTSHSTAEPPGCKGAFHILFYFIHGETFDMGHGQRKCVLPLSWWRTVRARQPQAAHSFSRWHSSLCILPTAPTALFLEVFFFWLRNKAEVLATCGHLKGHGVFQNVGVLA